MELFADRPPWWLAGPLFVLIVVALLATINQRIGVLGGYSEVVERISGRTRALGWKAWFLFGIVGGALLHGLVSDASRASDGYGWLTRTFESDAAVAALLVTGGALIGFGAKTAGGCTSGNGLGGCALGSRAALLATMTFMATAVGVTFLTRWLGAAA